MPKNETVHRQVDARVARLAERQQALITRRQAESIGLSWSMLRQRIERGQLRRTEYEQVLAIAGAPRTLRQQIMSACLAVDGAIASHETAAILHGFEVPTNVITLTASIRRHPRGIRMHLDRDLTQTDVTTVGGIPCTSVARTLIDLAATRTHDEVEQFFGNALRRRLTNVIRVHSRAEQLLKPGRGGAKLVLQLAREYRFGRRHPLDSELERRFLRDVIDAHGLPAPTPQHVVWDGRRRVARVDFAYVDVPLAIQVDSWAYHFTREEWENDRTKDNDLAALGWLVVHVTSGDIRNRSARAAEQIRRAISTRQGVPHAAGNAV